MALPPYSLNIGNLKIPKVGLGTYNSPRTEVKAAVITAVKAGYRHIDCAAIYKNEKEVGEALKELFTQGVVKREDLFITSKLWNTEHRPERVRPACEKTLKDLNLEYLDLYLMHKMLAFPPESESFFVIEKVPVEVTWKAMEELVTAGLVKAIGVSTFPVGVLHNLLCGCTIPPACNQIELHPFLQERDLIEYCADRNIAVGAFCPVVRPPEVQDEFNIYKNPVLTKIAQKHNKTQAQVALRWNIQRSPIITVVPKSVTPSHIVENINLFDFVLDDEDMAAIATLDKGFHISQPKKEFNIPFLGDSYRDGK